MAKKFTKELLEEYMKRDGATLVGEYVNLYVRSRIKFICKCGEIHDKEFRRFVNPGKVCCLKCEYDKKSETKKFNKNFLDECIKRDDATLIGDYKKINRESDIKYKCKCGIESTKNFRLIVENGGAFCDTCRVKNTIKKREDTNLEKYGCVNPMQNEEIHKKGEETNLVKYGCKNVFQNEEIKENIKKNNIKKYGVDNLAKTDEVKKKIKKTFLEKYGTENIQQLDEIKNKIKKTNLEKYGVTCALNNIDIQEKSKATNLRKYGTEISQQSEIVKNKIKKSYQERHGVDHPMQLSKFFNKGFKSSFLYKDYKLPSGKNIKIQGYERFALDYLLYYQNFPENNVVTGSDNVPEIWYIGEDNKNHRHYVDIFIPSQNKCIEVKSPWTYESGGKDIFLKQEAGKKLGYEYEIWVYDKKGNKVECYE